MRCTVNTRRGNRHSHAQGRVRMWVTNVWQFPGCSHNGALVCGRVEKKGVYKHTATCRILSTCNLFSVPVLFVCSRLPGCFLASQMITYGANAANRGLNDADHILYDTGPWLYEAGHRLNSVIRCEMMLVIGLMIPVGFIWCHWEVNDVDPRLYDTVLGSLMFLGTQMMPFEAKRSYWQVEWSHSAFTQCRSAF